MGLIVLVAALGAWYMMKQSGGDAADQKNQPIVRLRRACGQCGVAVQKQPK